MFCISADSKGDSREWRRPDYGKRRFGLKDVTPPRVFFVRVADKGLMLDAASSASTKDTRLRVEGSGLNEERFGELNTETQSSQRSETGTELEIEVGLAASPSSLRMNMGNGSMDFDYCQGNSTIILSFERETRKWSGWKGLEEISEFDETPLSSWPFVPQGKREFCSLVRRGKTVSSEW